MPLEPAIRALIEDCIRGQSQLHRWLAVIGVVFSAFLFVFSIFAPRQPGEGGIVAGFMVVCVVGFVLSTVVYRSAASRAARIRTLLYETPHEITSLDLHTSSPSNSAARATSVRMTTRSGELITLLVPNEATGRTIIAALERARDNAHDARP